MNNEMKHHEHISKENEKNEVRSDEHLKHENTESHDHKKECKECKKLREEIENHEDEINKLRKIQAEKEDSYLRKAAEFDNYRKRVIKQLEDCAVDANKEIIVQLLPLMDNFDRAIKSADNNKDFNSLYEGLKIIYSQLNSLFSHFGVTAIDSLGKEFDHNLHEALIMEERNDIEHNTTVVEEMEKGYKLGDMVIRHSKVKVAKKKVN